MNFELFGVFQENSEQKIINKSVFRYIYLSFSR
jgi:hypothetical protein